MQVVEKLKDLVLHHDEVAEKAERMREVVSPNDTRRASFAMARGHKYMKAETEDVTPNYTAKMQPFLLKKIQTWFDVMLDADGDGYLTRRDMETTAHRLAQIAGWPLDSEEATTTKDALRSILEAFLDVQHKNINDGKISRDEFLNFIGKTSRGAASVKDFPYPVQLFPRIMFAAIGSGKSVLTQEDLSNFYRAYLQHNKDGKPHSPQEIDAYTQRAYRAFTGNGTIPLSAHVYGLVFSNFLLGRSQQTPGKYILPCFDIDGTLDAKRYVINWPVDD